MLTAADILVYVEGADKKPKRGGGDDRDDDDDEDDDDRPSGKGVKTIVKVGSKSTFKANVSALNGILRLQERSRSTGSFVARDIRVDKSARVRLQSGWFPDVIHTKPEPEQGFTAKLALADVPEEAAPEVFEFGMDQNFPNPFNPSTTIRYALPQATDVQLTVYNVLGQEVRVLVSQYLPAGAHAIQWDGRDAIGRAVSSGIYMYRLVAGEKVAVRRMIFLK